ncbi:MULTISPECIES: hypothetical protein [Streptomyces]|uniref:Uncharacterized protein n=1 Tax=Streptomyces caniscabiei TaxID=2746961 RepID=A0ABU4MJV7_9ACTN|nr:MULTISPECIES: hypothetical protein [Streptomyces]MBE4735192.1 hypothetical protein [Streptomyces caniscabiei]MBE4754326.1 hypothetical protein [Streptomyces caniscabiei]MBE4767918.1 hypothetical protein [Streptomyces caniscabiei]MBE4784374.1 hypothetical protein [Streptomyces caniscabiei]MBE4791127.1 hypothetical protein [Streptomyces caniscabiei]
MTEQTNQLNAVAGTVDVSWDLGVGLVSAVGDMPDAPFSAGDGVQIRFFSRLWISLDTSGRPVALDVFDVPSVLVGVIPLARRDKEGASAAPLGTIPWLLDTDSNWVWIMLIAAPARQRLVREGWVEMWLYQDRLVRLKVRAPVAGTPTSARRATL